MVLLFLAEPAAAVPAGTRAVVLLDRAGRHGAAALGAVSPNPAPVPLPACAPGLNAIERVWEYLRERYLSHRLFRDTAALIDACCAAWNRPLAEPRPHPLPRQFPLAR